MALFDSIRIKRPRRNKFDLSHERKMSLNMGKLVPIMCEEIVPGDKFRVRSEILLRFAPMLAPVMHRVNVFTHYFFVPNRLIWTEWEDFITGGREGTSNPVYPFITINTDSLGNFTLGTLSDYFGLPVVNNGVTEVLSPINISALPFRAYQTIYDEYYRDQNLTPPVGVTKGSGEVPLAQLANLMLLRDRAWEKDYFTSALPWAQRGPEVLMPISGEAEVTYKTDSLFNQDGTPIAVGGDLEAVPTVGDGAFPRITGTTEPLNIENIESVEFENSQVTINELRRSIKLQEWLEKNARGGARYIEQILSHFGVKSSDARLQRPEYLGGGKAPVRISEVLSTFQDPGGAGDPQANMAGHGVSFGTTNGFRRHFEEHGFVIGIMSILPKTAYQNGVHRMWTRDDRFKYFWPEFANIGEQEVRQEEIYHNVSQLGMNPEATWGYQSRYAEYKYGCSTVHGDMREQLSFWHMGRIFDAVPPLNTGFVTSDPTNRIFPTLDPDVANNMYCHVFNRIDALRPMPYFGTPTL